MTSDGITYSLVELGTGLLAVALELLLSVGRGAREVGLDSSRSPVNVA